MTSYRKKLIEVAYSSKPLTKSARGKNPPETTLGCHPCNVSQEDMGYNTEGRDGQTERLHFVQLKAIVWRQTP